MSLEDKERLEKELKERVIGNLQSREEVGNLIRFTLRNFSYRYLESETTGEGEPTEREKTLLVELQEPKLSQALKTQNSLTRKGLIDLAKSFSKKDNPTVCYRIGVDLTHLNNQGGGDFHIFAEVNWDFPHFESSSSKKNQKMTKISYDNGFELRNDLARVLEEVCEVF
ncbi:MAG: hypothetical protein NXH75_05365 [Halobacteriovoraceae bacterium]|nr:hypothetical protein [Halobacteriovoraceae bacterium]